MSVENKVAQVSMLLRNYVLFLVLIIDKDGHAWPLELLTEKFVSLEASGVARTKQIMVHLDNVPMQL